MTPPPRTADKGVEQLTHERDQAIAAGHELADLLDDAIEATGYAPIPVGRVEEFRIRYPRPLR